MSTETAKRVTKLCVRQGSVVAYVPRLVDPFIHLSSGQNVENEFAEIVKASGVMEMAVLTVCCTCLFSKQ